MDMALRFSVGETVVSANRAEWTINNFLSTTMGLKYCLSSKEFRFKGERCRFSLFRRASSNYGWIGFAISVGVELNSSWSPSDWSEYTVHVSVRNLNGEQTQRSCIKCDARCFRNVLLVTDTFLRSETLVQNKHELVPEGHLTVIFSLQKEGAEPVEVKSQSSEVSAAAGDESVQKSGTNARRVVPVPKGVDRLLQNLRDMYLGAENADAILKVENREFPVHKAILRARSIVFDAMFGHDMAERNTDIANIPDCSAAAFEILLLYVYTGSCGDSICADNVFDLFYAADKYLVDDLKEVCAEFMKDTLSVDTFCEVIATALKHDESDLLEASERFFSDNVRKIIKTVSWQRFIEANPIQCNELFIKALNA